MKLFFTLLIVSVSVFSNAQVICGTSPEGGVVTLTAPPGNVFIAIEFASYGTPNGSCGSFTIGGCHAVNSAIISQTAFVGQNSASLSATNGVFGDPCGGTFKRLYIQARYSSILPLTLVSFNARKTEQNKVRLEWITDHEVNSSEFVIEKSTDGKIFDAAGTVAAAGGGLYSFTDAVLADQPVYFYRLKMVDHDGRYRYSNIVRVHNRTDVTGLSVFPNPASGSVTVTSDKKQEAIISNISGQPVKKLMLIGGSQVINTESLKPGVYFIKTPETVTRFVRL